MALQSIYLDAGAGGGGDGSSGSPYNSWAAVITGEQSGFNSGSDPYEFIFRSGTNYAAFSISGWSPTVTKTMLLRADAGDEHLGVPGAGVIIEGDVSGGQVQITDEYVTLQDLEIRSTNTFGARHGVTLDPGAANTTLRRCIVQGGSNTTSNGINNASAIDGVTIEACLCHNSGGYGILINNFSNWDLDYNTVVNNGEGIHRSGGGGGTCDADGNISYSNTTSDWTQTASFVGVDNACTTSVGTDPVTTLTDADFVDFSGGDFTPSSGNDLIAGGTAAEAPTTAINGVAYLDPPSIGAYEVAGGGGSTVSVTPPSGSVSYTGQSPAVSTSDNQLVSPPSGSVSYTGYAPVVTGAANIAVSPPAGAVSYTGQAPTVSTSDHQIVSPGAGVVSYTGYAPTISIGDSQTVEPPTGSVVYTGLAPTVTGIGNVSVEPPTGTVIYTGLAPSISVSNDLIVEVPAGSVSYTGNAPTVSVSDHQVVEPGTGSVIYTGQVPVVSVGDAQVVEPPTGSVTYSGHAPTVTASGAVIIRPATGVVGYTGYAPDASASNDNRVFPGTGAVTYTGHAPTFRQSVKHIPRSRLVGIPKEQRYVGVGR